MNGDLISRSALLKEMRVSGKAAYMVVQDAPAVDAVEVVRCKDCERRDKTADLTNDILCPYMEAIMPKNAFCSYGERRADRE